MPEDDYSLTRREAARILGIAYTTVELWEKQGKLGFVEVMHGKQREVRLSRRQVEALRMERDREKASDNVWEEAERLRQRSAALEAENATLREELAREASRTDKFLEALVKLASPKNPNEATS